MSVLDKELIANKKPYFQKYVYPKLNYEYKQFSKFKEYHSLVKYGVEAKDNNDEDFVKYIKFKNPVLDNNSVMNRICHYLESEISEIKSDVKQYDKDIVNSILTDNDRPLLLEYKTLFDKFIVQYKQFREREKSMVSKFSSEEELNKQIRFKDVCRIIRTEAYQTIHNSADIANLAVYCGYNNKSEINKDFVWNIFGKEVFMNVKKNSNNSIYIPVHCDKEESEFMYLNEYYKKMEVKNDNV